MVWPSEVALARIDAVYLSTFQEKPQQFENKLASSVDAIHVICVQNLYTENSYVLSVPSVY